MTVEVIAQSSHVEEQVPEPTPPVVELDSAEENKALNDDVNVPTPTNVKTVDKCSSYKEETNFVSDLKENEKKALFDLKAKLEEAILANLLFKKEVEKPKPKAAAAEENKDGDTVREKGEEKEEEKTTNDEKEAVKSEEFVEVENEISIWGIPLLPSTKEGHSDRTDVVLLKFLRAREFKVNEAFEMLKKTLQWRREFKIDSSIHENDEFGADLESAAYMSGVDREGHPICYNIYGVFNSKDDLYQKAFGTEEKRGQFLRWRFQLMEKGIQKLDFKAGGVNSLLQIIDLNNSPSLLFKKELRVATKQAVQLLQDNYPEFVSRNIIINVPYWYYAFNAILSPFLTQRTKSKFAVAHPSKVNETLLKYIAIEEIPIQYGGFKRDNDFEFSPKDEEGQVAELVIKSGSSETIEIPMPEAGTTILWDVTVVGWEVNYKEEFVPCDEGSYTIIVHKENKIESAAGTPIRNTFRNNEAGKIVITITNASSSKKKKKALYRYKTKKTSNF